VLNFPSIRLGAEPKRRAVSYIQIKTQRGHSFLEAGIDTNIELAFDQGDRQRAEPGVRPAMKAAPGKPALTGETLATAHRALEERGERLSAPVRSWDWLYKKRARTWKEMDEPA